MEDQLAELSEKNQELEQRNNRLVEGYKYLADLVKEQLSREEAADGSDSLILTMQVLNVVSDILDYEFSFDDGGEDIEH